MRRGITYLFLMVLVVLQTGCQAAVQKTGIENGEIFVAWKGVTLMHVTDLPKFSDYPAKEKFSGKWAEDINFASNDRARRFRTRLREGLGKDPDFAGKYRIVGIGCGTSCTENFILNLENGDVIDGFNSSMGVLSKPDSELIIANIPLDNPQYMMSGTFSSTRYYVFHDKKLTLLKEIKYSNFYTTKDLCNLSREDFYCER